MAEPQREWFEKDYYSVLGVSEKASAKDISKAYKKLARELHPDANPGDESAEERFKEVSGAYDVIGDEDKRKSYDEVRHMGPMAGGMFGGGPGPGPGAGGFNDIGDLLGGLFGRGRSRGAGPQQGRAQRGADLEAELKLDFDDAVEGLETTIHLTSEASCSTCSGSGSKPGSGPEKCRNCGGRGVLDDNQGLFSMSRPCGPCGGRGSVITDPCPACRGSGSEIRPREVKVRIPAGVKSGQKIRLKGRGGPGRGGGPPGDLFVHVKVKDHHLYGRAGSDLTLEVPVSFDEAVLGADISVPTLDGGSVRMRIPPGTSPGKTFRLRGKGGAGDLLVTVTIAVPSSLTDEQRSAVQAFADTNTQSPRAHLGT